MLHCDVNARYQIDEVSGPINEAGFVTNDHTCAIEGRVSPDPLLRLEPAGYIERLAGLHVPRHGKVRCPFHDDGTPSLHVYREPQRGWYCYGCRRGGSIYDFASLLWGIKARGASFVELRRKLTTFMAT